MGKMGKKRMMSILSFGKGGSNNGLPQVSSVLPLPWFKSGFKIFDPTCVNSWAFLST